MTPPLDGYYSAYFAKLGNEATVEFFEIHRRRYAHNFDPLIEGISRDGTALDIGCGIGQFLYYLRAAGFRSLEGIDFDGAMLEQARKMLPDARLSVGSAQELLTGATEKYDLIAMNDVIEHIPRLDVVPLLRAIRGALKAEGVLLVKTPNMANPMSLQIRYKDFTHRLGFTESSLEQVLREAGFQDMVAYPEEGPVTSWRARLRKLLFLRTALMLLRFLHYCLEMNPVPKVLTQWVIVRCPKGS
jgi:2-polyprenyl-3-methyl-5-hydroxy-6-metoxy-1,4-benzoquinol methylase